MKLAISEILKTASEMKTKKERIEYILKNDSPALQIILKYAYDPKIEWLLPKGDVPFKPNEYGEESRLYIDARRLYIFVKEDDKYGNKNLKPFRRQMLFIELLEECIPDDAKLLVAIKDKNIPYKFITPKLVKEIYPHLFELEEDGENKQVQTQ